MRCSPRATPGCPSGPTASPCGSSSTPRPDSRSSGPRSPCSTPRHCAGTPRRSRRGPPRMAWSSCRTARPRWRPRSGSCSSRLARPGSRSRRRARCAPPAPSASRASCSRTRSSRRPRSRSSRPSSPTPTSRSSRGSTRSRPSRRWNAGSRHPGPRCPDRSTCSSSSGRRADAPAPAPSTRPRRSRGASPTSPALRLAGVAGYEGSLGHDRSATAMVAVRDYLSDLLELHEAVRRIAPDDELIVSAGGSAYLDVVADVFDFEIEAEAEGARTRWVLRSGASLLHDDGFYHGISPLDGDRATAGTAALAPAMRGYARVVSHPEPRLALLDGGKRDFPYDEGLPVPFGVATALGGDETPLAGASVTALNDQHAFLRSDAPLPVVDRRRRVARALAPVHRLRQAALAPRRRARRQHARRRPRAHVLLRHGHRMTLLHPRRGRRRRRRLRRHGAGRRRTSTSWSRASASPASSLAERTPVDAAATVIEGRGRLLMPGFVDAHAHADGLVFDPDVQLALLRQGVTTVIGGQDGVSYAPGDGAYASEYFAAINGPHPSYRGGGIGALLAGYDGTTPAERRHARARGHGAPRGVRRGPRMPRRRRSSPRCARSWPTGSPRAPSASRPGSTTCRACSPRPRSSPPWPSRSRRRARVYVSHMRGGYEANSAAGIDEVAAIARHSGVAVHVSHFHAEPPIVHDLMGGLAASGVDATFDAYPYTRGCSILAMPILPASLTVRPTAEVLAVLADPDERARAAARLVPDHRRLPEPRARLARDAHARARRRTRVRVDARPHPRRGRAAGGLRPGHVRARRARRLAARGERGDGGAQRALPRRARVDPRASARARRLRRHLRRRASASRGRAARSRATCARSSSSSGVLSLAGCRGPRLHARRRPVRARPARAHPHRAGSPTSCSSTPTPCATARRTTSRSPSRRASTTCSSPACPCWRAARSRARRPAAASVARPCAATAVRDRDRHRDHRGGLTCRRA